MRDVIFLILTIFALSGCLEHVDNRLVRFYNLSNKTVYVFKSKTNSFTLPYIHSYPDTTMESDKINSMKELELQHVTGWKTFIEDSKDGKMRIFLVEQDSVDKYGIKEVLKKSIYTKVYKVNLQDLKDCKWEITYTGK